MHNTYTLYHKGKEVTVNVDWGYMFIQTVPYLDRDGNLQFETHTTVNGEKTISRPLRIKYD